MRPAAREYHTAVWLGVHMMVWGGYDGSYLNTGGNYDPSTDSWTATPTTNAPTARRFHTAVSTAPQMSVWGGLFEAIVFGGFDGTEYDFTGGIYSPQSTPTPTPAPTATATATFTPSATPTPPVIGCCELQFGCAMETQTICVNAGGTWYRDRVCRNGQCVEPSPTPTPTPTPSAVLGCCEFLLIPCEMITEAQCTSEHGIRWLRDHVCHNGQCRVRVITNPATEVASYSATLNGSVDPNGLTTTVYFYYGPTTSYGHTAASQTITGNTYQSVSANISGLTLSTTYHCVCIAHNSEGTFYGNDITFTTPSATGPPVALTNPPTLVGSSSAILNGQCYPHGLTTNVHCEYGTTTSYGHTTASQTKTGNTYQSFSENVSGLTPSTTYHFRSVATNSAGTTHGSDRTFTTLSATGPPVVITNPATLIASFSGTLNGTVDPHGLSATVYFQYGTTTSYGSTTAATQSKSGNTYQNVAGNISGLAANTTYHFRIVATNSAGTVHGSDVTFTTLSPTGRPVVITNPATNVASSSATLNGSVDPHGLTSSVHFQYGTTTSYGHTTASQAKTGNTYQSVTANVSGLSASTTYHFRIVATNSGGTADGSDRTFRTTP